MIEQIDKRIIALESELAELRRRKIGLLQAQIAEVEASLPSGAPVSYKASGKAAAKSGKSGWAADLQSKGGWAAEQASSRTSAGWAAELAATKAGGWGGEPSGKAGKGPKRRGRRPGKRVPDEAVLPSIAKLVGAAGKEGISARKVSQVTGLFYPRVVKLMEGNFKKTGERKWSRYHLK
jgi:hypothetical protein